GDHADPVAPCGPPVQEDGHVQLGCDRHQVAVGLVRVDLVGPEGPLEGDEQARAGRLLEVAEEEPAVGLVPQLPQGLGVVAVSGTAASWWLIAHVRVSPWAELRTRLSHPPGLNPAG